MCTLTSVTPGTWRTAASESRASCAPTFGFSVWKWMAKETRPPSICRLRTKPNETMSRERPGKRTVFSASRICSCEGIAFLLLESLERSANDRNRLVRRGDDRDDIQIAGADQPSFDHRLADPVDQTGPHCTDQNHRMLLHVLDLQKLPDHEELERGADAARHHDEGGGETDEVVQAGKEGPVPEHLVHERIRPLLGRQMDGQSERARMALHLSLDGAGVGGFHEARAAAGDDVHAHAGQLIGELLDLFVDRIAAPDAGA